MLLEYDFVKNMRIKNDIVKKKDHLSWRADYEACSMIPISERFQLLWFNCLSYNLQRFMIPYALFFVFSVLTS